jgi:hypothetical protein
MKVGQDRGAHCKMHWLLIQVVCYIYIKAMSVTARGLHATPGSIFYHPAECVYAFVLFIKGYTQISPKKFYEKCLLKMLPNFSAAFTEQLLKGISKTPLSY